MGSYKVSALWLPSFFGKFRLKGPASHDKMKLIAKKAGDLGSYLNPDNKKFQRTVQSEIYADKTGLIKFTNERLNTAQQYLCVSRPRRFGKSTAADMLAAYYSRGCDSQRLFAGFEIAGEESFSRNLNQYDTIVANMQEFLSRTENMPEMLELFKRRVLWELLEKYPYVWYFDKTDLIGVNV